MTFQKFSEKLVILKITEFLMASSALLPVIFCLNLNETLLLLLLSLLLLLLLLLSSGKSTLAPALSKGG